jgi:hypothetical protein
MEFENDGIGVTGWKEGWSHEWEVTGLEGQGSIEVVMN